MGSEIGECTSLGHSESHDLLHHGRVGDIQAFPLLLTLPLWVLWELLGECLAQAELQTQGRPVVPWILGSVLEFSHLAVAGGPGLTGIPRTKVCPHP